MLFYTIKSFSPRFARQFHIKSAPCYTLKFTSIQGANSQLSREQGDTKFYLGSTKNYLGEHHENNSGSWEKTVQFQREPGAGDPPPLQSLVYC